MEAAYVANVPQWLRDRVAAEYGYGERGGAEVAEVLEEVGAFLFETEFEQELLDELDDASHKWWTKVRGLFAKAFSLVTGRGADDEASFERAGGLSDAHAAMREMMDAVLASDGEEAVGVGEEGEEGDEKYSRRRSGTENAKNPREALPAIGRETNPTIAPEDSGANISITDGNRKQILDSLDGLRGKNIPDPKQFLSALKRAFGFKSDKGSKYVHQIRDDERLTLRISDHRAKAIQFAERKEPTGNTSVVVKLFDTRFHPARGAELVQFVYYPDKFSKAKADDIVDGVKNWIDVGTFNGTLADSVESSGNGLVSRGEVVPLDAKEAGKKLSELVDDGDEVDVGGVSYSVVRPGKAFHVSAADFEKFDSSFMGTGEGSQYYGWGMYFLTRPRVWRNYREQFTRFGEAKELTPEMLKKASELEKIYSEKVEAVKPIRENYYDLLHQCRDIERKIHEACQSVYGELWLTAEDRRVWQLGVDAFFKIDQVNSALLDDYDVDCLVKNVLSFKREVSNSSCSLKQELLDVLESINPLLEKARALKPELVSSKRAVDIASDSAMRAYDNWFAAKTGRSVVRPYTYRVEFDETAENMLDWTKALTQEQFYKFLAALQKRNPELATFYEGYRDHPPVLSRLHTDARKNDRRDISLALDDAGFIGHTMPVGGTTTDDYRHGHNYVIYNADERVKITGRVRWSIRRKEQEAWNAVLDAYEAGTLPQRGMNVVLGRTPVVLQRCGAEDLPIKISKSVLDKVVSEKHGISVSELRKLLTNIDDPIAVFRSRTQENSLVVLTEIIDEKNGDNAIVAIRLDAKENRGANEHEINAVSSIYGRPSGQIEGFMRDGLALYVNQKKSRAYARSKRLQLPPEASKRGNLSLLTEEDFSDDALGEIKVNPESFGERQSRSYRAADTQEQEYQRNADAAILAVYKLVGGAVSEKCKWLRTLPEWEQAAVVNRSEIICKFARLRLGTKGPVSISQARRAVLSASSFDIDRLKNAIVFDSVTNGVYVERRARAKLSDELALMEAQGAKEGRGLMLSTDLSDEAVRLGEALTGSQGAAAAIRGSAQTLTERAGALRTLLRDAAKRFGLEEGASEAAVVEALAAAAERASLPAEHVAKLRAAGNALGSEEFEAETDAGKMKRAAAADIVAETLSAVGVSEEMLSSGMASVKDRAVENRAEQEGADADTAEDAARRAFEGEEPSALAARAAASVLRGAWKKVSRALGVSGLEVETFVGGDVSPAGLLSLIEAQARARAEALEAEADACTRKMAAGALSLEERRKLNGKRNGLRSDAGKVRAAASPGGALCAAFKADAEALAKRMLQRGGGAATVNATVALRAAFSTRDAIGAACSLLLTAGNKEAAASLPYLRGRLRGLLFSMPKLDERTDDASSYYTAEWRVLANQLREVGSVWWDKSFEEVQAEIDRLEGAEASDDHMRARIRALQLVGGAKNMSAPMLDKAFWEILSERDTSFLEQRQDVRARRRETEQGAADFLNAVAQNPHAKPLDKSMAQDVAEQVTSQGVLSFGDRLRGWVKHAKGNLREKALAWIDGMEKRLSDAASTHDALEVEQNDWAVRTMRGIFGAGWKARVSRLCTVALPDLAKFEHTSNALAKQGVVSPMRALHIYMSARQKSFGGALLTPGAFSEESRGALETRRKYVEQAREGGELETFLKTFEGGVLWKLKEAYAARWKELFPRLNAAYRGVFGFDLYDPFGETDYYPLKLKSGEDSAGRGKVARSGAVMLPVARRFRSRTVNVAELETNRTFLEVATEQIEDTLHTIAYAEAHSQMEAFVGNAKIAETLAARVSGTDLNGFRDHLADILAMPSQRPEGNRAGRVVNALTAVIALGGNVLTPIRQATGGWTYAAESPFGAGATTAAMLYPLWGTLWGGQYLADAARVWRDPLFRARYEETSRLLDQAALRGKAGHGAKGAARAFFKTLKNALMWGVKAGDAVPIMTCGVGFYRLYYAQNLRRGMTEAQAHDDAMRGMMALTEKTQQTRRMMNKTSWQRSSGGLTQVLTQFKSMNDQALGNEARAIADLAAGLGDGKRWRKAFRSVVAHHLLFGAFSDFVMQCVFMALSGDDDDDLSFWEKLNLWELGAAAAGGGLYGSTFAFVAFDLLGAGEQVRLVAKDMGADVPRGVPSTAWGASVVPAVSVMTNMLRRTGRAVRFGLDEDKDAEDAWREFAKAFGGGKTMLRIADRIAADGEDDGEK